MKRFLPIKVIDSYFGYGWWWGKTVYFKCNAELKSRFILSSLRYAKNGNIVGKGSECSWSKERQRQAREAKPS